MKAYIVTYDLHRPGQNYTDLAAALKEYRPHWHMQGSVWVIGTEQTAVQVRNRLSPFLDESDTLFVGRLEGEAAWRGLGSQGSEWLKKLLTEPA